MSRTVRIGIGGAIGCGKTELIEKLVPKLVEQGFKVGAISNDVYSKEDARRLAARLGKDIDPNLIIGIETGGCPHTAVRDDPSMNIDAAEKLEKDNPGLDVILIESGGDKTIRKGGLGIKKSDLLLINKIDLAPYVESTILESGVKTANLDLMMQDAKNLRGDKPTLLLSLKDGTGLDELVKIIREKALFK
jgi:urease accessory protein